MCENSPLSQRATQAGAALVSNINTSPALTFDGKQRRP